MFGGPKVSENKFTFRESRRWRVHNAYNYKHLHDDDDYDDVSETHNSKITGELSRALILARENSRDR